MTKIAELKPKVSIIGCGNVGMRYAYALIMKGLARSIVITDMDKKRLEGEVMDLRLGQRLRPQSPASFLSRVPAENC